MPRWPSIQSAKAGKVGLGGGEAGDGVHGHGAPAAAAKGADPAGDPQGLCGMGEVQAGDGGDLQAAGLGTTVATGVGGEDGVDGSTRSSSGRNRAISLVVCSTLVWARTAPLEY
jgi:hypothetical protein